MSSGLDLQISENSQGFYDIQLDQNGDLLGANSFDTAILMTLLCEKRADASEIRDVSQRRGWWGNILSDIQGFEIGSKFWLLSQARKTQDTLNSAITYLQNSFSWFVTQGYAKSVTVNGSINKDGMILNIIIYIGKDSTTTNYYNSWLKTGFFNINVQIT